MKNLVITLAIFGLFAATAHAQQSEAPTQPNLGIRAENCMVGYINKVDIPALAEGKLKEIRFEEGVTVSADDIVAMIDDTQMRLTLKLKEAEAEEALLNAANDINKKDAINTEKIARAEAEAYKELHEEKAIPYWELRKKILEADRAELRITLADMQMRIAKEQYLAKRAELRIAEHEITRREIKAPFAGFIEKRIAQLGQWVQPGSPVATLVQMDELKVEGDFDALRYSGKITIGTPVIVRVFHNANRDDAVEIQSVISYVSSEIDLNNRYRVWTKIKNKPLGKNDWLIKPGMLAEIEINKPQGGQGLF